MSEINGSWNRVTVWDKHGTAKYDASFGPGDRIPALNIRDIDTADLDGDGTPEILVAKKTGLLVVLTGKCKRLWGVTPAEGGAPVILVVLEDGTVKVLNSSGNLLSQGMVDGTPVCLLQLGDGLVVIGTGKGSLEIVAL